MLINLVDILSGHLHLSGLWLWVEEGRIKEDIEKKLGCMLRILNYFWFDCQHNLQDLYDHLRRKILFTL